MEEKQFSDITKRERERERERATQHCYSHIQSILYAHTGTSAVALRL
jgi:hypothetical protein